MGRENLGGLGGGTGNLGTWGSVEEEAGGKAGRVVGLLGRWAGAGGGRWGDCRPREVGWWGSGMGEQSGWQSWAEVEGGGGQGA